jgi:hypothetical protein
MSDQPRVILHLGASKCGTTSFQVFLNSHREELLARKILVPDCARGNINHKGLGAYVGIGQQLTRYAELHNLTQDNLDQFEAYFESKLLEEVGECDPQTVLMSYEGLFRFNDAQISKLMGLIHKISKDVHVIAVLRRHDRWAVSSYNTRLVGHGTASKDQLTNDEGRPHGFNYGQRLSQWEKYVGRKNMTVFAFEDHEDILVPYLAAIDYTPDKIEAGRQNVGISAYGQEVLRYYNEIRVRDGIKAGDQRLMRQALKVILPTGHPTLPAAADVADHLKAFEADRDHLRGNWLSPNSKFFDDLKVYPERRTEIIVTDAELADWVEKAKNVSPQEVLRIRSGY